jgi:hypothetical protein
VIERRNAGVDVRVMLNPARSGGDRANDETFERFAAAGITVQSDADGKKECVIYSKHTPVLLST